MRLIYAYKASSCQHPASRSDCTLVEGSADCCYEHDWESARQSKAYFEGHLGESYTDPLVESRFEYLLEVAN
jgi:hypothetical protein